MLPALGLLSATAVSVVGSQLTLVALPWFVLQITGSAAQTGLAGGVLGLPQFAAGILGGAIIDRLGYRRVSVAADLVSGLGIGLIPLLVGSVGLTFGQLLVLVFLGGLLTVPGLTARRAMLPDLARLGNMRLERINAAFEGSSYVALLIGPAIAGVLVSVIGAQNVLWLDAASFALSAAVVRVAVPSLGAPTSAARATWRSIARDLAGGLRFLARDRLLRALAIQLAITNLLFGPLLGVVLAVYARDRFGSATALGVLIAATGFGLVIGAVLYGWVGHRASRRWLWVAGYCAVPPAYAALLLDLPLPILATIFGIGGVVAGPVNPLLVTVRHERIPPELRGRVFSTFTAVAQVAAPAGIAVAGAAIEVVGFAPTVAVLGGAAALVAVSLAALPVLRELDAGRAASV